MADCPGDEEVVIVSEVATSPTPAECVENSTAATMRQVSSPTDSQEDSQSQLECPICLQTCAHPVELPCKHIFCFLCIKGVAMQGPHGRCAICRSNIPHNVLTHPRLKDVSQLYKHAKTTSGFEWFYEARGGGWWQYDERSIQELEKAYETGQTTCQLLIAGHLYDIDFSQMTQFRQNNRNLFRRIKRDTASAEKRGIAGIRLNQTSRGNGATNGDGSNAPPSGRRRRHNATIQASPNPQGDSLSAPNNRPASQTLSDSSQSQPSSRSSTGSGQLVVVSESESDNECVGEGNERDSDDSDYIVDEEDDMELGEEEELGESNSEGEDEEELRDGARAPTRRSDRSTSSTNQTPPPASATNGASAVAVNGSSRNPSNTSPNSNPSGRASRGTRADKANAGSRSSTIINNGGGGGVGAGGGGPGSAGAAVNHGHGSSGSSPSPQFFVDGGMRTIAASNIRLSPAPVQSDLCQPLSQTGCNNNLGSSRTSSSSITTTSGLTCLLIGPGVRITVDQDNSNNDETDEIL